MQRYAVARVVAEPRSPTAQTLPADGMASPTFVCTVPPDVLVAVQRNLPLAARDAYSADVESVDVWCVFDNTATGAALDNAWELRRLLIEGSDSTRSRSIGSTNRASMGGAIQRPATLGLSLRPLTPAFPIAHRALTHGIVLWVGNDGADVRTQPKRIMCARTRRIGT